MSESDQQAYERYMFDRAKDESTFHSAWLQGMTEGKIEGKIEEKQENVRKMRIEGLDLALIAKISGLSEAEILAL